MDKETSSEFENVEEDDEIDGLFLDQLFFENLGSVYRSIDTLNYKVYRVLDYVCLRLATFRVNFFSSPGKMEGVFFLTIL